MFIVHLEAEGKPNMEFRCTGVDCITVTRAIKNVYSSILSLETRKITLRDRSRTQKLLGLSMLNYATHTEKNSSA